ncbi:MAG TPA: hypothetical protein VEA59_04185, partial [Patescibacteria group bacterium]|nr:hypothetical protein [Patescibacteria group bacterium]
KRYHAAVARPNVVYGQLPLRASDIPGLIAQANTRPPDPLAVDLVYAEVESNALSILKHNLPYLEAKDEAFRAEWLSLAKSMFGNLLLDELTKSVQQADLTPKPGIFAGRFYEDVCVDVEGTLVDKNGKLQPEVVNLVIQLAETYPITLWTGGNVANAERQIRELGISRKITAKQLMRGATVSMVIDDMPQAEFDSEYGVLYTHYKRI